jgi:hypothetical protein
LSRALLRAAAAASSFAARAFNAGATIVSVPAVAFSGFNAMERDKWPRVHVDNPVLGKGEIMQNPKIAPPMMVGMDPMLSPQRVVLIKLAPSY